MNLVLRMYFQEETLFCKASKNFRGWKGTQWSGVGQFEELDPVLLSVFHHQHASILKSLTTFAWWIPPIYSVIQPSKNLSFSYKFKIFNCYFSVTEHDGNRRAIVKRRRRIAWASHNRKPRDSRENFKEVHSGDSIPKHFVWLFTDDRHW